MIENEVNHDDDDGRQFSMDLSTHSRFAMAFDLKPLCLDIHTHFLESSCAEEKIVGVVLHHHIR